LKNILQMQRMEISNSISFAAATHGLKIWSSLAFMIQFCAHYLQFIRVKLVKSINQKYKRGKKMPEYLVLLKVNPAKLAETLEAIRKMEQKPVAGVDLQYTINIFGSWDAGLWINAEENAKTLQFVQKKLKELNGVTDVYPIPTFPHGDGEST